MSDLQDFSDYFEGALASDESGAWLTTKALASSDASYFRALAVSCGDQDEQAITLVERWQVIGGGLDDLQAELAKLMTKHKGDRRFAQRCRDAFSTRAELATLEKSKLFNEWWPGCGSIRNPN